MTGPIVDVFGNRAEETYTYRLVDWDTWLEGADLGNITNGSVELSAFSDLKASCSFSFKGEAPLQDSIVRIYYSFKDDYNVTASYVIGTFIIGYSRCTYIEDVDGLIAVGEAECQSVLKVLQDRKFGLPLTIPAGEQPIQLAVSLIERDCGLRVNVGEESSYVLANDHTFEPDATYLEIVNWCLNSAGYMSVRPNENGICSIEPYSGGGKVIAEFANDDNSIMYPEVSMENDWQSTPNVVRAYYEDDTVAMYAVAKNVSGSKASLASRNGRELTLYESVSELEGESHDEMLSALKDYAERKLRDNSNEIERVTLSHPYIKIFPLDAISIQYSGKSWKGNVQNIRISLEPSTKCDTETRRLSAPSIVVDTEECEILWEAEPAFAAVASTTAAEHGGNAVFTCSVTGASGELEFMWKYSDNGGRTWKNAIWSGAQTDTLTVNADENQYNIFRCRVTAQGEYVYSNKVRVVFA